MYFDPNVLTRQERLRVDRWLVANGVREHVSLEQPVVVRGRHVEYGAMCRRDKKSMRRSDWIGRRKKVRIRVPFSAVS